MSTSKKSLQVSEARRKNMQAVRSKGNKTTEKLLIILFRKNKISGWRRHLPLPGKPDFTFKKEKVTVFVDGCFWHKCHKCYREPKTNTEFWRNKIETNVKRDRRVTKELKKAGWSVFRIWECQLRKPKRSLTRIQKLLAKKRNLN
jgi:DNA mismatch endonuclease (patch repair protein)